MPIECNSVTSVLGMCSTIMLVFSEFLPYLKFRNCNSITQVILHLFKKAGCASTMDDMEQNTKDMSAMLDELKNDVIIELRNELGILKGNRESIDV
jgi:hypothetical protein